MLHHHLVPRWRVHPFLFVFGKTLGVEVANEFLMRFSHDASQGLEVPNVQPAPGAFHENFVEERLDRLALRFLHVKPGQVSEPCRHHVPRRDGFFRVQIARRGAEGVDAQGQSLAAKRRPNSDFATVQQLLGSGHDAVFFLQLSEVNAEGQPGQITLRVDDEGGNACQRRFFDEGFGHHGLARTGGTEHGAVAGEDLRGDVNGFTGVSSRAQKHPLWFVLALPRRRTPRNRVGHRRGVVVEQIADEVTDRGSGRAAVRRWRRNLVLG